VRTFVSALATVLGILLAAVAVPAIWLDRNFVGEDGFVSLAAPMGQDPEFRQQLATAAVGTIDTSAVPGFLNDLVQPVLENAATTLTGLPGYPAAWDETLRKSHRLSFASTAGDAGAAGQASSLTLDVAPLVALGVEEISRTSGIPLDAPQETLINVGQPEHREWVERLGTYAPMGYLLAIGSGVAFLLALVAARRRWTVGAAAGIGALLMAGAWKLATDAGTARALATDTGNDVANLFRDGFVPAAASNFGGWTLGTAVAGGVLLVLALVGGAVSRRRPRATR
jgi:hypothetical protein